MAAAPTSPWSRVPIATSTNLRDVLSEQLAEQLQLEEDPTVKSKVVETVGSLPEIDTIVETHGTAGDPELDLQQSEHNDSDYLLAKLLQEQFDSEYDETLRLRERQLNGNSKVAVSLDNFKLTSRAERELLSARDAEEMSAQSGSEEDEPAPTFNRKGICVQGDRIVTKHDADLNSKQNVNRMNAVSYCFFNLLSFYYEYSQLFHRLV